jgi:hypothetical protein
MESKKNRCPIHCNGDHIVSRRKFLYNTSTLVIGSLFIGGCNSDSSKNNIIKRIQPQGPGSTYVPKVKAAFVRRKEDYGMWWPGAVYDGEAARKKYTQLLLETAKKHGIEYDLRTEPIFSDAEADAWISEAKNEKSDGLIVILLDRQQHAWPTAHIAANSGIPTIIFSPLGSSFTTNTIKLAKQPGCVIYSTDDFSQAAYGMKMLKAGAKMQRSKCVVIKGNKRYETIMNDLGITLKYIPAKSFIEEYRNMETSEEILAMAKEYERLANRRKGATPEDVVYGIKSYSVARNILEREKGDAISMDCLGALANEKISLPCIAWSRMNDDGVPAACEADTGAIAAHVVVQNLFDRPGFQQDPVADTSSDTLIGAHCSCPTRLNGFNMPPEPFEIIHHHGNRDAVPRTIWKIGQRVTCLDVLPGINEKEKYQKTKMLVSEGTVVENVSVPPAGGCVVSVKVKFDGNQDVLTFPGFHQLFFYGEFKDQLKEFCQLFNFDVEIV